jgi:hypothetical protein
VSTTGGGQDDDGNPIPVADTDSDPVSCYFNTNKYEHNGTYDGGKFTVASFYIFIDGGAEVTYKKLKLFDKSGRQIGSSTFEIQNVQYLDVTGCTKITI